jgi:hypothetical protein
MTKFFQIIQLIRYIGELVKTVEQQIPLPGKGKEKLEFVLSVVDAAAVQAGESVAQVADIVGKWVGLFNKTGVFKTTPK